MDMKLHKAASSGDSDGVETLLKKGADLNTPNVDFATPLSWAARNGHKEVVKLLLSKEGIDPDSKDNTQSTPLSWAARNGHEEVVKLLLSKEGVDPDSKDDTKMTPLSWAAENGHKEVVKLLLSKEGVDPESKDNFGATPLFRAAQGGHATVVELFLYENSIDLNSRIKIGTTPLAIAAERGHEEVVKLLLSKEGVDPDSKGNSGMTPLSCAACNGHEKVVKLLLSKEGIDPDSKDNTQSTPLSCAACNGHEEVVKLLLSKEGVDPDSKDNTQSTPLSCAARNGHKEVVKLLLSKEGVDPESSDNTTMTPLSWAARNGHEEVVKLLLSKEGVDPDSRDNTKMTPLSWAARNGHEKVVKLLLDKDGVDLDSYDIDDVTPLCWASRYGHAGVTGLLIARGAKYNSKDKNGHTPLWWATENSRSTVVKLLLEQGGVTLHTLVQRGERTQIRLLLSEGNVDSRNSFNQTPLHIAVLTRQTEIAGELISHGADINAEDGRGCTSLRLAINQKSPDLINLLLKHSADPRGIEKREWLSAYGRQSLATVWLMERRADGPSVNIVTDREILEPIPLWKPERNMLIFDPESTLPWQKGWLKNAAAKLEISHDESPQGVRYFVTASLPISIAFYDGKNSPMPIGISWTMMPPAIPNGESSWKSITHLSVLPYGWIPDNGIEFFALFMAELEKRWSALCDETKTYLHTCRIDQLEKKGKTPELIDRLATLARNLAEIRNYVQDQFHEARPFSDDYRRRYNETVRVSEKGQATVNRCFENTTKKLDELDQTVRDLLQFEFAWVSINESFKSTSTATSTKRLSWVTFIFLPAMFASSLFGMNVDMLKDNPDWRWYIPVVAASLLLTITAWLTFKYNPIETRIEECVNSFYQKLKGQHAVQTPKVHNETRTNLEKVQTGDANLLHEKSPV